MAVGTFTDRPRLDAMSALIPYATSPTYGRYSHSACPCLAHFRAAMSGYYYCEVPPIPDRTGSVGHNGDLTTQWPRVRTSAAQTILADIASRTVAVLH